MPKNKGDDRFLMQRYGGWYYYYRRVPKRFMHVDDRSYVKFSLHTDDPNLARKRRDLIAEADDAWWAGLAVEAAENGGVSAVTRAVADRRYRAVVARAMAMGFEYHSATDLARDASTVDILARLNFLETRAGSPSVAPRTEDIVAVIGGQEDVSEDVTVREAFELYVDKIAFDDQYNKSDAQKYSWKKTKKTSVDYFVDQMGDLRLGQIDRSLATKYRNWWQKKVQSGEVTPNTANRHIGNVRSLLKRYYAYKGNDGFEDPFRGFFFKGKSEAKRVPFEDEWVRTRILEPGMFDELRLELRVLVYLLIETGARLSELVNLRAENIRLNHKVPHIQIRPEQKRELKTDDSVRDIPLVGVALAAIQACPDGFPYYYDRATLVSANLMKAFRIRKLLPTSQHVIYSFRHAFEDRMLHGELDYGLRCALMGHKNDRPEYGTGGSLEHKRDQLAKIAHPFDPAIFKASETT